MVVSLEILSPGSCNEIISLILEHVNYELFGIFKPSWSSCCASVVNKTWLVSMRMRVRSLALLSGLQGSQRCHELWVGHRLSISMAVAVTVASSCSLILSLAWEPPYASGCGPKKTKKWLWRRPVAIAPIRPLAWELCAMSKALEKTGKKKKRKTKLTNSTQPLNELPFLGKGPSTLRQALVGRESLHYPGGWQPGVQEPTPKILLNHGSF